MEDYSKFRKGNFVLVPTTLFKLGETYGHHQLIPAVVLDDEVTMLRLLGDNPAEISVLPGNKDDLLSLSLTPALMEQIGFEKKETGDGYSAWSYDVRDSEKKLVDEIEVRQDNQTGKFFLCRINLNLTIFQNYFLDMTGRELAIAANDLI